MFFFKREVIGLIQYCNKFFPGTIARMMDYWSYFSEKKKIVLFAELLDLFFFTAVQITKFSRGKKHCGRSKGENVFLTKWLWDCVIRSEQNACQVNSNFPFSYNVFKQFPSSNFCNPSPTMSTFNDFGREVICKHCEKRRNCW